jgi:hypothetical protein
MLFREWVDAERVLRALSEREYDLDPPEAAEERVAGAHGALSYRAGKLKTPAGGRPGLSGGRERGKNLIVQKIFNSIPQRSPG